jgi:hypothetical protein
MAHHPVFRGGRLHVLARRCDTCVFRRGNLMDLHPGRVEGMVAGALRNDSVIPCHSTLYDPAVQPAVCRGFFARYWRDVAGLRLARLMGLVELDPPPAKDQ